MTSVTACGWGEMSLLSAAESVMMPSLLGIMMSWRDKLISLVGAGGGVQCPAGMVMSLPGLVISLPGVSMLLCGGGRMDSLGGLRTRTGDVSISLSGVSVSLNGVLMSLIGVVTSLGCVDTISVVVQSLACSVAIFSPPTEELSSNSRSVLPSSSGPPPAATATETTINLGNDRPCQSRNIDQPCNIHWRNSVNMSQACVCPSQAGY